MTNMDPVMEPIFTKMIPCPGVGILKMIPCSAARPRTENYMSTPPGRYVCVAPPNHIYSWEQGGEITSQCLLGQGSSVLKQYK